MSIYSKSPLQLLVDALNAANPQLPYPINTTDFIFGKPAAITPTGGAIQNTKIKITPKRSSKYAGSLELTYRRLDLSVLFRGLTVQIQQYRGAGLFGTKVMLPLINEKYGFNFEDGVDIQTNDSFWNPGAAAGGGGSNTVRAFIAHANSPMYTGSFNVTWVSGKQELGVDIMTVSDIPGRVWPVTDFSVDRTRTAEFLFSDLDITEIAATIDPITKNTWYTLAINNSTTVALAKYIAANSPFATDSTLNANSTNFGMGGIDMYNMDISAITPAQIATFPFLATPKPGFNRVLILRNIPWANNGATPNYAALYYNV